MSRGSGGPRQPGGRRQIAGPRKWRGSHDERSGTGAKHGKPERGGSGNSSRAMAGKRGKLNKGASDESSRAMAGKRGKLKKGASDITSGVRSPSPLAGEGGERRRRAPGEGADLSLGASVSPAHPVAPRSARTERPLLRGERAEEVQTVTVAPDESGMRVDRFFEARFPGLSFSHIQRIIRKGEVRVNGKRVEPKDRLEAGQAVRIPPLKLDQPRPAKAEASEAEKTRAFLKSIMLYEDADVLVLNKPMGLAVQGGSGTTRHVDGMLESLREPQGQRPRLVHRLDKDTAGCLVVAKSRFAAAALAKSFRSRAARKIYWALVAGVPKPKQGRISTFLAKEEREEDSVMRVAAHGEKGASHAITYYAVIETAGQQLAWLSLKPVTGRTHQLRAHLAHINHPIVGDPKYFSKENWSLPGGMQNRLHLYARRIVVPHPRAGVIDVSAPLPPHMAQSFNLLGLDTSRYDPIEDAPEE